MNPHVRANLWLLGATLVLCCVVYPLVLLAIGRVAFPHQAEGSLIWVKDASGKEVPVGSLLIGQPFSGDEYFQPRPSATTPAYNAAASGASNWGANNYLLRDRVARQLGPVVKYRGGSPTGNTVQQDVEKWFHDKPDPVTAWADQHSGVAQAWVNADDKHKDAVRKWQEGHPEAVAEWKKANPGAGDPKPADLAVPFFKSNAAAFHQSWPKLIDDATWSVPAVFFDMWLQEHADVALEQVPADMVMASGPGLDPHITLKNALYQLDRVAGKWAETTKKDPQEVRKWIEALLHQKAGAPLGGLAGVEMVNVLEVNLALKEHFGAAAVAAR
jgi:K+-transporting ATPase ATPase C chain